MPITVQCPNCQAATQIPERASKATCPKCLKTFSAAESRTVLGVPDAYELPPIPGSGFLKVDTEMVRFKAAYVSGQYVPMQPVARADGELRASGVDIEPVVYSSLSAALRSNSQRCPASRLSHSRPPTTA